MRTHTAVRIGDHDPALGIAVRDLIAGRRPCDSVKGRPFEFAVRLGAVRADDADRAGKPATLVDDLGRDREATTIR